MVLVILGTPLRIDLAVRMADAKKDFDYMQS